MLGRLFLSVVLFVVGTHLLDGVGHHPGIRRRQLGHDLRRPMADYLRDGIHELRIRHGHVNYRILYFFHGQAVAILAHGLTKEDEVPDADIERAIQRKEAFAKNPAKHSQPEENEDA